MKDKIYMIMKELHSKNHYFRNMHMENILEKNDNLFYLDNYMKIIKKFPFLSRNVISRENINLK